MRIAHAWLLLRCDPPRLDEADGLLTRAYDVLSDLSFSPHLANCETEMARSALLRGDFDGAVRIAQRAVDRCAEAGAAEGAHAQVVSGLALVMAGQPEEGAAAAAAAAERLATMGSQLEAAHAWRELAEVLIQTGRTVEAIDALRRASDYAGVRASTIRSGLAAPVRD
jgi:ATP/maltotriose-dependent transcriptional regulator MalT